MYSSIITDLNSTILDFLDTAQIVDHALMQWKDHSEKATRLIDDLLNETNDALVHCEPMFESVRERRSRECRLLNECFVLITNVEKQKVDLAEIAGDDTESARVMESLANGLLSDTGEVSRDLEAVIGTYNRIIYLNDMFMKLLKKLMTSLVDLRKLVCLSARYAADFIAISAENVRQARSLDERLRQAEKQLRNGDRREIDGILVQVNWCRETAENMSRNAGVCYTNDARVMELSAALLAVSRQIDELSHERYNMIQASKGLISVVTSIITRSFARYFDMMKIAEGLECSRERREKMDMLKLRIEVASECITGIVALGRCMDADTRVKSNTEAMAVAKARGALDCGERIWRNLDAICVDALFPIEGSKRNIINCQTMEMHLRKLGEMCVSP